MELVTTQSPGPPAAPSISPDPYNTKTDRGTHAHRQFREKMGIRSPTYFDQLLLDKCRALLGTAMAADASRRGGSTTYEDFCQHLDTEDHGTRRAFELLLSETTSRRAKSGTTANAAAAPPRRVFPLAAADATARPTIASLRARSRAAFGSSSSAAHTSFFGQHWADEDDDDSASDDEPNPLFWANVLPDEALPGDRSMRIRGASRRTDAERDLIQVEREVEAARRRAAVTAEDRRERQQRLDNEAAGEAAFQRVRASRMDSILESPRSPPRRQRLLRRLGRYLGDSDSDDDPDALVSLLDLRRQSERLEGIHSVLDEATAAALAPPANESLLDESPLREGVWHAAPTDDYVMVPDHPDDNLLEGERPEELDGVRRGAFQEDLADSDGGAFGAYSSLQRAGARRRLAEMEEADGEVVLADLARAGRELSELRARLVEPDDAAVDATTTGTSSAPTPSSLFSPDESLASASEAPSPAPTCLPEPPAHTGPSTSAQLAEAAVRAQRAIRPLPAPTSAARVPRVAPSRDPEPHLAARQRLAELAARRTRA